MHILCLILASVLAQADASIPWVEQSVECISIAHLEEGVKLVFFWGLVQGEWTCLDHRWLSSQMNLSLVDGEWVLSWPDENENCYRVIRSPAYVESWEPESPLAELNQRPWFRQLLNPGLAHAPRRPQ